MVSYQQTSFLIFSDQYLSKTSSLPRNGSSRPKLASLSRKGSLPLTKPPPPPPSRKIPVPPPRTLQKQVTEPLLKTSGIVRDISNSISEVPETEVKPPLAPPRKRGEDFKNELEGKLACQPSSLPVDQDQRGQTVDNEHSKASPVNTRNTYRDSLEDDVFPPLPPEVVLKEEFREEKENKRIIIKPPRPSLRPPQKPAEQNTLEKTIKDDERPSETAAAPPPAAESNQSNNISETKPIPIGPPVGKHTPVPQPPAKPFSVPSSVSKPDVVAPPSIKPKPIVKKKPKLPPKPPNKPGSSFKYEEPDECGAEMSQDQASSLNVPDFRVPRKRPSHSLSDLIERRLRIEQIDLTERPYTSVVSFDLGYRVFGGILDRVFGAILDRVFQAIDKTGHLGPFKTRYVGPFRLFRTILDKVYWDHFRHGIWDRFRQFIYFLVSLPFGSSL